MRGISTEGFERPKDVSVGPAPMLQWIDISELVIDPAYQRPIAGKGLRNVARIAREFSWSCFAPVVVSPVEGGKFAIIDGQHRTTAAALIGLEKVPCQVVIAARGEQAAAFKAINGVTTPISRMALHAAALVAGEEWAVEIARVCVSAKVELLRYPVPLENQSPGQTMAVGAITQCLKRYGPQTLTIALQCVTLTANNRPGALSARMIKALCDVLDGHREWRDQCSALFEAFDRIDLGEIQAASALDAASKGLGRTAAIASQVRLELAMHMVPHQLAAE